MILIMNILIENCLLKVWIVHTRCVCVWFIPNAHRGVVPKIINLVLIRTLRTKSLLNSQLSFVCVCFLIENKRPKRTPEPMVCQHTLIYMIHHIWKTNRHLKVYIAAWCIMGRLHIFVHLFGYVFLVVDYNYRYIYDESIIVWNLYNRMAFA